MDMNEKVCKPCDSPGPHDPEEDKRLLIMIGWTDDAIASSTLMFLTAKRLELLKACDNDQVVLKKGEKNMWLEWVSCFVSKVVAFVRSQATEPVSPAGKHNLMR